MPASHEPSPTPMPSQPIALYCRRSLRSRAILTLVRPSDPFRVGKSSSVDRHSDHQLAWMYSLSAVELDGRVNGWCTRLFGVQVRLVTSDRVPRSRKLAYQLCVSISSVCYRSNARRKPARQQSILLSAYERLRTDHEVPEIKISVHLCHSQDMHLFQSTRRGDSELILPLRLPFLLREVFECLSKFSE